MGERQSVQSDRVSVRRLIARIRRLKADPPHVRTGVWYRTEKEHWLGWLSEYNMRGAYGRIPGKNRDAAYAYNHIVESAMLEWLARAAGVSPAAVRRGQRAMARHRMLQRKAGAFRKEVPWERVQGALWRTRREHVAG